jgi:hypothetical protein
MDIGAQSISFDGERASEGEVGWKLSRVCQGCTLENHLKAKASAS